MTRYRISMALEALLWTAALGWIIFLVWDFKATGSLRSLGEFILIALLVWWPMVRHRIKFGVWV